MESHRTDPRGLAIAYLLRSGEARRPRNGEDVAVSLQVPHRACLRHQARRRPCCKITIGRAATAYCLESGGGGSGDSRGRRGKPEGDPRAWPARPATSPDPCMDSAGRALPMRMMSIRRRRSVRDGKGCRGSPEALIELALPTRTSADPQCMTATGELPLVCCDRRRRAFPDGDGHFVVGLERLFELHARAASADPPSTTPGKEDRADTAHYCGSAEARRSTDGQNGRRGRPSGASFELALRHTKHGADLDVRHRQSCCTGAILRRSGGDSRRSAMAKAAR